MSLADTRRRAARGDLLEGEVLEALGEADPAMLTLYAIAEATGAHPGEYGTTISSLHARRLVAREQLFAGDQPLYRLLPQGRRAYLQAQAARRPRPRRGAS